MVSSVTVTGQERTVLVVEAETESDPALAAALAYWGCTVVHVAGSREALAHLAAQMPALLFIPDGGSTVSGSYIATVAGRKVETLHGQARPRDVVLQRPIDPVELEELLGTVFGPPAPSHLPHGRAGAAAA